MAFGSAVGVGPRTHDVSVAVCAESSVTRGTPRVNNRRRRRSVTTIKAPPVPAPSVGQSTWAGSSRYPSDWSEAAQHAALAAGKAVDDRIARLTIRVRHPSMRDPAALAELCLRLIEALKQRGKRRIVLFFNSDRERTGVAAILSARPRALPADVRLAVLGKDSLAHADHAAVVVTPSNIAPRAAETPNVIEALEFLHYDGWRESPRPVILINPNLVALTVYSTRDHRPPSFISDYTDVYHLDTRVFERPTVSGALLLCYPRQWEIYARFARTPGIGFRLISNHVTRPSGEKIVGELMWRAEH